MRSGDRIGSSPVNDYAAENDRGRLALVASLQEKHLQCWKTLTVMIFPNFFDWKHAKNAWQMRYCGKRNGDFTAGKQKCRKTL